MILCSKKPQCVHNNPLYYNYLPRVKEEQWQSDKAVVYLVGCKL